MAVETELKLSIPSGHLAALRRHRLLKALATAPVTRQKLYSVYYDTPELDLRSHAMALRLRRAGSQWLQTLKGGGGVQAGLHLRNEWEMPVAGEALDFEALKAGGGKLPKGVRRRLQPVFVTDFTRSVHQLEFEGASIELGLDSGEIRAGKKVRPISELELELKSGEPRQLFELALKLLDAVPLLVENTSKAEYGYRLFSGEPAGASKASFPRLEQSQDVASALRSMAGAALLHVQSNVPGAVTGHDEEYLHQVRVGMRRLRVVLAMAETWRADGQLAALHQEVAEMCSEFGSLREWDVFITHTLQPLRARFPGFPGLEDLVAVCEKRRTRHRTAVVHRLQSSDYQRLLLRFGSWLYGSYWHDSEGGSVLLDFARQVLRKRSRQVDKRGGHIGSADAGQLHLLRIACKKLRYSAEMFGTVFTSAKVKRYTSALSELQDIMGLLNDIAVAHRLLDSVAEDGKGEILALVQGWLEHEQGEQSALLGGAWKRFSRQRAFWE